MALSLLGVSLPTFLIGILLILVFSVTLGWFPSFGRGEVSWSNEIGQRDRTSIVPMETIS
jgi:ABC-type dipeptide/oligopeptide/nickel transport system permease component